MDTLIFSGMDLQELNRLAARGEGQHIEFKIKLPEPEKLIREAVALANSGGGHLLLGVDDDGTVRGLKDAFEGKEAFEQAVVKHSKPVIEYQLQEVPVTRKRSVIAIYIPDSAVKPHRLVGPSNGHKPMTIIRIADRSTVASKEMFHILRLQKDQRDLKVEYGDKESALMQYLAENSSATIEDFMRVAGISRYIASRTLVHLVRANVLTIEPGENRDIYRAKAAGPA